MNIEKPISFEKNIIARKSTAHKNREGVAAFLFILPGLLGFLVFFLIPFFMSVYYSFVDSTITMRFVGFDNYRILFKNLMFRKASYNTLIFMGISIPVCMFLSLMLSLLLNKELYSRRLLRTFNLLPIVVPVGSVVLFWKVLFDYSGYINGILSGLGGGRIDFLGSKWAMAVIIAMYTWKNMGFGILIFLGALQNVPRECYEAAELDGAGAFRKFCDVTLVYIIPSVFFNFIIFFMNSFKVFREIYLMAGDYPNGSIYMLQHFMNNMFISIDYQKLTTAAFIMAAVIGAAVWVILKIEKRATAFLG